MTEQEKLPKELPMIGDKYWDCFAQMELQRNADQLLYDALWAENERLIKCLLNIANLLQYSGGT